MKKLTLLLSALLVSACTQNNLAMDNKKATAVNENLPTTINANKQKLTANDIKHPQNRNATPSEIAECQKQGGSISKEGMAQFDFCVVEFADKGKTCDDGSQCQSGRCLSDGMPTDNELTDNKGNKRQGVCAKNNVPFGCYSQIKNGKATAFLCVD